MPCLKALRRVAAPCVSPWGYERIQRWTAKGTDPNRSFNPDGEIVAGRSFNPEAATDESTALIRLLREDMGGVDWTCHLDLHETTDTDETGKRFHPIYFSRCRRAAAHQMKQNLGPQKQPGTETRNIRRK